MVVWESANGSSECAVAHLTVRGRAARAPLTTRGRAARASHNQRFAPRAPLTTRGARHVCLYNGYQILAQNLGKFGSTPVPPSMLVPRRANSGMRQARAISLPSWFARLGLPDAALPGALCQGRAVYQRGVAGCIGGVNHFCALPWQITAPTCDLGDTTSEPLHQGKPSR